MSIHIDNFLPSFFLWLSAMLNSHECSQCSRRLLTESKPSHVFGANALNVPEGDGTMGVYEDEYDDGEDETSHTHRLDWI
jgi:hypothetical protein